eukprot:scaffold4064_cov47-Phaeocystis_antarctica.AAC.1
MESPESDVGLYRPTSLPTYFCQNSAFLATSAARPCERARVASRGEARASGLVLGMCEPCTPDTLLEAVRGLRVADPDLGFKPLLAKLQAQQPELGAATKEVREALAALKAESEAAKAAAAAPPVADESGAPSNVALSLACIGCLRLPSAMDDE